MNFRISSFKKRITAALLSTAMFFNMTSFPADHIQAYNNTKTICDVDVIWNETEELWETAETTNVFGSYTFSAYWDPREKTLDYFWDATSGSGINSQETKIIFTFNSSDTNNEWKVNGGGTGISPDGTNTNKYDGNPDIWFEIPGIASAKRGEKQAPLLGQDSKSIVCDGYDLTNDKAVYELKTDVRTLNGGVEIVWGYNPRELVNGYGLKDGSELTDAIGDTFDYDENLSLHPCAYIKVYNQENNYELVKVRLPEMHFGFVSERDNVLVDLNEGEQDNLDSGKLDSDYSWKRVYTEFYTYAKTQPIDDSKFYIELKKADVDVFGEGNVYLQINGDYNIVSTNNNKFETITRDGTDYYRVEIDYNGLEKWSSQTNAGLSSKSSPVDLYLGVRKEAIINRATAEYERDYSGDNARIAELTAKAEIGGLTADEQTELDGLITKKNDAIRNYIVTTDNGVETLNYTINVNSRIVRSYADEEGNMVDYDIPQNEQGSIISGDIEIKTDNKNTVSRADFYPDTHIDSAIFGFLADPTYGSGGIAITKSSGNPLRTSSDMASGNRDKYKVSVKSTNIAGTYNVTIKDDCLIVLLDDNTTDYNKNTDENGNIIKDFSYEYSASNPNSKYRLLQPDEYDFISLTMPAYFNITDVNGTEKSFDYTVKLIGQDSNTIGNPLKGNTEEAEIFDLTGKNVKAIEINMENVEGSLDNYTPEFEVEFNLKNDDTHGEYRSGTGSLNALAADPYGKLINFAMVYAEQTEDGVKYYYGESTNDNNPPDRYNGYVDSNGAKFVYKDNTLYNNGGEYLTNTDGKNIYAIRSSADLFIRDPAVDVSTNTSYKKSNGAVIDLEKTTIDGITEATIKTAGQFYTELTSTLNMVPTEDTRFDKLIIRTVMPKVLADANGLTGSSKLSLSNVNIKNITLLENGASKPLTASDLINYYDRSNTYDNSIFNKNKTPGQDYVEIITELDFSGKDAHIEIPKGVTGSISLTYPLFMNYATENNWKNQINLNDFYGATTAEIIPFSPTSITGNGNQGIQGSIETYYKPNDTSKVQASSVAVNQLPKTASSWNEIAIKTVKSTLSKGSLDSPGTFGKYAEVNKWNENDTDAQKKMSDYEYKLYFQMGNTEASRIFIYDNIEEAEDYDTALGESAIPSESKWKGTLKNVFVTGNETNLNTDGSDTTLKATVFYSTEKISSDLYCNENEYVAETDEQGKNDTRNTPEGGVNWIEAEEYSTNPNYKMSDVKAFCVMVEGINSKGEYVHIAKAQEIYFTVQMTKPKPKSEDISDDEIVNTDTYNKFTVRYARLQNDGSRDESFEKAFPNYPINSNHTTVTLRDTILKLKIVKTDKERKNKWSNDTHYMPISGAKFKIDSYDENNGNRTTVKNKLTNQDNQDYFETDEYGEITVNLAKGWYILTETDAPTGYRTANEIMFYVNATDENGNLKYSSGEEIPDLKLKNGNSFVPVDTNDENRNVFLKYTGSEEVYAENGETISMHTLQLEVADEIIPGKVTITKYDETYKNVMSSLKITSGEQKTVAGVSYCLYKANGTKLGDPVYVTKETNGEYKCEKSQNESSSQGTTSKSNTVETDDNGQIIITELPWGSFFLVEQSAPVGYEVPDTTDRSKYVSFSITPDLKTDEDKNYLMIDNVSAWDKETGLSVELTKYDWDDKTATISNAEFNLEIYNTKSGKWESWDGYHNKITQNGSITFTNGKIPVLAFGQKYRIVEVNPAADYKKPEDPYSIEFDFTGNELDNTSDSPVESETDEVINSTTNVKVKKTIYPVDDSSQGKKIKKVEVKKYEAGNETHILSKNEFQLTINENDHTVKVDISMYNERKQSKLTIFKTDKDGNALAGAAFALYEVVGTADNLSLDSKGNIQFDNNGGVIRTAAEGEDILLMPRKVTDKNGKIEIPDNLDWDKYYYFVEMSSPKGYKQNNEIIGPFKLRDEIKKPASQTSLVQISNQEDTVNLQWNVENEQIPGSVTLRKYAGDQKGNKTVDPNSNEYIMLAGAKFKLVNNKGETVKNTENGDKAIKVNGTSLENNAPLENMLTDSDGVLTIENLPWGYGYQLIETEAPEGYDTVEIKKFSIDADHTVIEKEAIDPVKTTSLTIRKSVNEWRKAFGDATFIFKVKEMNENGTNYTGNEYTKMITINEEDPIDTDGRRSDSVKFYGLDASKKYEVTEILVARYTLDDIIANDSTATIEKDTNYKTTRKCIVTLKADDSENNVVAKNEIEYKNNLTYYDKFSENKTEPNPIEKQQMITGVNFRVDTSKLDPNTFGLVQPSISDTYYDFFPKDENGKLIKDTNENGTQSYRSDALVVKIYPDRTSDDSTDTQNEGIRIYPQGHELYDETVGYYELLDHTETENNVTTTYVSKGKVYYLQSPRDENLTIRVTLPEDTSQYSWATTNHEDSDIIHIDLADMPMPITLKFHSVSKDGSMPYDGETYQPVRIGGIILSETATFDLKFNYNDRTDKYEVENGKTLTAPKVYMTGTKNITFSYWTIDGTTQIESISMEDFVKNYVIAENDGRTFEFYPVYVEGRAMFDKNLLREKTQDSQAKDKQQITAVVQEPSKPDWATDDNLVSLTSSKADKNSDDYKQYKDEATLDIWAIRENNVLYWYSEDSTPYTPTYMGYFFQNNYKMESIKGVENWDTSRTTSMHSLFQNCTSLVKANLENWDTHSIVNGSDQNNQQSFQDMFNGCTNLETVNLTINTAGKNVSMQGMFKNNQSKLSNVTITGDFSGISTSASTFYKCYNLNILNLNHISMEPDSSSNELEKVNIASKPFQNCESFSYMFGECKALNTIIGIEDWNPSKVKKMNNMFQNCSALTSIDVSNFNTSNVTDMSYMFHNCSDLTSINGLYRFDTSSCTSFRDMFRACKKLEVIDISSFTTGKGTRPLTIQGAFYKCSALETIYANPDEWPHIETSTAMDNLKSVFADCPNLTLRNGNTKNNVFMAVVDGAPVVDGMGDSRFTYQTRTDVNGKTVYTGYFTDWSSSPHYEEVKAAYDIKVANGKT